MKKRLLTVVMCALCSVASSVSAQSSYCVKVLTFEDCDYKGDTNIAGSDDWSSLIDQKQYGGTLLYGESGMGTTEEGKAYGWYDKKHTELRCFVNHSWGSWAYWNGGAAISNYSADISVGGYETQLAIPYSVQGTSGHAGSENFCVCYGYEDTSGFGSDARPIFTFGDGEERVIEYAYINNTAYFLHSVTQGDGFNNAAGSDTFIDLVAQGFDSNGEPTGEVTLRLVGDGKYITEWTKMDLTNLGPIATLKFDFRASEDQMGDYGLNTPAYFAIDDIAVRFPLSESLPGDMDGDGQVTMKDANIIINMYLGK